MNPYYVPQYMQQPQWQPVQQIPQTAQETKVVPYFVDTAEQLSTINPMPNVIYLGINTKDGKIFMRRMNNDGLMELKTYSVVGEHTKRTDTQEILGRLAKIEKKLGVSNERNVIDVTK